MADVTSVLHSFPIAVLALLGLITIVAVLVRYIRRESKVREQMLTFAIELYGQMREAAIEGDPSRLEKMRSFAVTALALSREERERLINEIVADSWTLDQQDEAGE